MPTYPAVEAWQVRLRTEIEANYPLLAEALRTEEPGFWAVPQMAHLLGCGWTLSQMEAAIARARACDRPVRRRTGDPVIPKDALRLISLLHLSPAEFDGWSAMFDHNIWSLTGREVRDLIDMWRATLGGTGLLPLAALCAQAGLTPPEARAMHADGALTEHGLRTLIMLRRAA